ncbi:hypothetical protein [Thermoflexus sp.]|uniref:hypothetical protein n=1 Tax=Thermoflexus sp. TaxID=1969742 RepID=UPI00332DD1FC
MLRWLRRLFRPTSDFQEFLRQVAQRPDWQAELRRWVLTQELEGLPQRMQEATGRLAEEQRRLEETIARLAAAQAQTQVQVAQLGGVIQHLAEAQVRTQETVQRLIEAQAQFEQRLTRLEEAMIRAEERLTRLEETVQRLIEAQAQFEQRLARLEEAQIRTEEILGYILQEIAGLHRSQQRMQESQQKMQDTLNRFGAVVGTFVEGRMAVYMERWLSQQGFRMLEPITFLPLAEEGELDGVAAAQDPQGNPVWVLVSAKAKIDTGDVERFSGMLRRKRVQALLRERGIRGTALPYLFGLTMERDVPQVARRWGIGLVLDERGEQVAPQPWRLEEEGTPA